MRARAVTGESGHRLVCGWDLATLHSSQLGTGSEPEKVFSTEIEWKSADLGFLLLGVRTKQDRLDFRYEQLARHIINFGYQHNWPCQYGNNQGVRCVRVLNDEKRIVEVRFSKGKIYERYVDEKT